MTEFWEKTKSLECFSTEDRGVEYFEDHLYTRCSGGIRSVKKSSNEIVGRADCEEDPISCSKIDLGKQYTVEYTKFLYRLKIIVGRAKRGQQVYYTRWLTKIRFKCTKIQCKE